MYITLLFGLHFSEAKALVPDLGDNQSRYLCKKYRLKLCAIAESLCQCQRSVEQKPVSLPCMLAKQRSKILFFSSVCCCVCACLCNNWKTTDRKLM